MSLGHNTRYYINKLFDNLLFKIVGHKYSNLYSRVLYGSCPRIIAVQIVINATLR